MKNISMLPVRCISTRSSNLNSLIVGQQYTIDRLSIYIDGDGDAYGIVYDLMGKRIGNMLLKHFSCL